MTTEPDVKTAKELMNGWVKNFNRKTPYFGGRKVYAEFEDHKGRYFTTVFYGKRIFFRTSYDSDPGAGKDSYMRLKLNLWEEGGSVWNGTEMGKCNEIFQGFLDYLKKAGIKKSVRGPDAIRD